jgi:taurine dioxygenase
MKFRHIQVDPMTPTIGCMISGVDLNTTRSEDVYEEIKQALWQHGVVFFRKQALKPEAYIRLGPKLWRDGTARVLPSHRGPSTNSADLEQGNEAPRPTAGTPT